MAELENASPVQERDGAPPPGRATAPGTDVPLLRLQRLAGNRAVAGLLGGRHAVPSGSAGGLALQRVHDSVGADDTDHGPDDFDLDRGASYIDWNELTAQALRRRSDDTLFAVFFNLATYHYARAGVVANPPLDAEALRVRYLHWKHGGVLHTRAAFKALIGLGHRLEASDGTDAIIQRARSADTYSLNGGYRGPTYGFQYENVIYLRDGQGNIDFDADPVDVVDDYNQAETPGVDEDDIEWDDPVDDGSEVELGNDLSDPDYGLMPSGKKVRISTASRSQHFAIADDVYPNDRRGKWTWHHLSPRYKMVLVDMRVHAKHGHNGGVYIW